MSIALIDGDLVVYPAAASAEGDPEEIALLRTDQTMMGILSGFDSYILFLSGSNNFRYDINPEYKANRRNIQKPKWLASCQDFLIREYKASITDGYETDDALGMAQNELTTICSFDKDLMMIPGKHYDFRPKAKITTDVSEIDGLRSFYRQMLIGDTTDNIIGIENIGKVRAGKLINHLESEEEMHHVVSFAYGLDNKKFSMNADCLWIWRKHGETYTKRMDSWKNKELCDKCSTTWFTPMAPQI